MTPTQTTTPSEHLHSFFASMQELLNQDASEYNDLIQQLEDQQALITMQQGEIAGLRIQRDELRGQIEYMDGLESEAKKQKHANTELKRELNRLKSMNPDRMKQQIDAQRKKIDELQKVANSNRAQLISFNAEVKRERTDYNALAIYFNDVQTRYNQALEHLHGILRQETVRTVAVTDDWFVSIHPIAVKLNDGSMRHPAIIWHNGGGTSRMAVLDNGELHLMPSPPGGFKMTKALQELAIPEITAFTENGDQYTTDQLDRFCVLKQSVEDIRQSYGIDDIRPMPLKDTTGKIRAKEPAHV